MKKIVAFKSKDWHGENPGEGIMWYLRSKEIAWYTPSLWYVAAIGLAFMAGALIF